MCQSFFLIKNLTLTQGAFVKFAKVLKTFFIEPLKWLFLNMIVARAVCESIVKWFCFFQSLFGSLAISLLEVCYCDINDEKIIND